MNLSELISNHLLLKKHPHLDLRFKGTCYRFIRLLDPDLYELRAEASVLAYELQSLAFLATIATRRLTVVTVRFCKHTSGKIGPTKKSECILMPKYVSKKAMIKLCYTGIT